MTQTFLLSLLVFTPGVVGVLLLLVPGRAETVHRAAGLLAGTFTLGLGISLWMQFDPANPSFQLLEVREWLPAAGIQFRLGLDGVSLLLVLLTVLLFPIVLLASWGTVRERFKGYVSAMLVLETGILGALLATDLFLFYVFWELMLIPMFFIIGVWGGKRRIYASVKFVLFTLAGSLLMLVGILYLGFLHHRQFHAWSFAYEDMLRLEIPMGAGFWGNPQMLLFAAFALAFAVKVPAWPLHTWLPDAHVEAPTGGSIVLTGVLLKLGAYGLLRFNRPLFPEAWDAATPLFIVLAAVAIVYGALLAWAQKDMKKLVAYASVSHMGFILLGLFAGTVASTQGALLQMVNHGLSTGALLLLMGMLHERRQSLLIEDFGGLAAVMPLLTGAFLLSTLSSIGLPGLNGFVGTFLILAGSFARHPVAVVVAGTGIVLGAVYMLSLVRRVFWNDLTHPENQRLADMRGAEVAAFLPLAVLMVWIGVRPGHFLALSEAAIRLIVGG